MKCTVIENNGAGAFLIAKRMSLLTCNIIIVGIKQVWIWRKITLICRLTVKPKLPQLYFDKCDKHERIINPTCLAKIYLCNSNLQCVTNN